MLLLPSQDSMANLPATHKSCGCDRAGSCRIWGGLPTVSAFSRPCQQEGWGLPMKESGSSTHSGSYHTGRTVQVGQDCHHLRWGKKCGGCQPVVSPPAKGLKGLLVNQASGGICNCLVTKWRFHEGKWCGNTQLAMSQPVEPMDYILQQHSWMCLPAWAKPRHVPPEHPDSSAGSSSTQPVLNSSFISPASWTKKAPKTSNIASRILHKHLLC